jgi:CRISPR-associated protein Cas2
MNQERVRPGFTKGSMQPVGDDEPALYVVAYDIGDDAARAFVHKVLTGYGESMQFSVFECWLSRRDLLRLARTLRPRNFSAGDRVELFRCAGRSSATGVVASWWIA